MPKACEILTYNIPVYEPEFTGIRPPRVYSTAKGVNRPYFETFKNEVLSRYVARCYRLEGIDSQYAPKPTLLVPHGKQRWQTMLDKPKTHLSFTSPSEICKVDNLYLACQFNREYCKDNTGRLHPLDYFNPREYRWHCPQELNQGYLRYPQMYVKYKQPLTYPLYMKKTWVPPQLEPHRHLTGKRHPEPDLCFPR